MKMLPPILALVVVPTIAAAAADESPLAPGAAPQQVDVTGAGEGPAWHPSGDLYFSGGNRITRLDSAGVAHIYRSPSGGSNGLLFDQQKRLVTCEGRNRRVTRTEPDGTITVLTDGYQGRRYNAPNDVTIDSKGRIYFSDPRYGSRDGMEIRDASGRAVEGVYRIDAPGQVSRIITHEADRPNGVLVTPDDKYLFVADNNNNVVGGARKLLRFDLQPDGTVDAASRKIVFDWQTGRGPDGMAIDRSGRLYVAAGLNKPHPPAETAAKFKGGVYIFSAAGKWIAFVPIPRDEVTNCTFGGPDLKTLYITGGGTLWRIRTHTAGWVPSVGQ